ncbi:MAG: bifunctional glutamate N-acetyltransferase/amino-acid acetyltransferase ArgJ [Hyphomicrobiaceae bacterium]|nr:bifunctional glutamate N-acetyltransferase/amino-acid acetyltransferase ArgJ [Hyphomicrobiaceae bacterium]
MSGDVSPFAPTQFPVAGPVGGVRLATAEAGIKYKNRTDVLLAAFPEGTSAAGMFTTSRCPSAPVDWCRRALAGGRARALLVNSGNANAFTGQKGRASTQRSAAIVADALGCAPEAVFLASTGVIGEPLDAEKFAGVIDTLTAALAGQDAADARYWTDAARAIMTTDTFPKPGGRTVDLGDGTSVRLAGMAKGAGMIAPDMATMLSFLFTDAAIAPSVLQALLKDAVEPSFNCVTVDGDTSTSDTVLLFATGASGIAEITSLDDPRARAIGAALAGLCLELAHWIAKDGEGARKFVEIRVEGAVSDASAKAIAKSIANSPLVKTAIAGEDANWGRIVMAVGKAGEPAERDRLAIWFGDVRVAVEGERDPAYSEAAASAVMEASDITIRVELGMGPGTARMWTCDLTKEYVAINGDYRS